jgi:DNA-binding NarL/FixJ family response regulator
MPSITDDAPFTAKDYVLLLLLTDQSLSVQDIRTELSNAGLRLSAFAVYHLRYSFHHTIQVMAEEGYRVNKADPHLGNKLRQSLCMTEINKRGADKLYHLPPVAKLKKVPSDSSTTKQSRKEHIIALLKQGLKQSAIAKAVNVSRAYVCQIKKRLPASPPSTSTKSYR